VPENTQRLVGQPKGLSVTDSLARTFNNIVAAGGTRPTIGGTTGTVLPLAQGATVQSVAVQTSPAGV
jgi:hypothetical protein